MAHWRRWLIVCCTATLAWAVWSLYAWHYPLLNWYNAPLALAAAWAVTRFVEGGRRRYVVLAGAMAGIAIAQKISGLFLLAALLVWCVAHVAHVARREPAYTRGPGYAVFVTGVGTVFVLLVARLVLGLPHETHGSAKFLIVLLIAVTVLWLGWSAYTAAVPSGEGVQALVALLLLLAAGVAVPLVPFLLVYVAHGGMSDLIVGVFVRPAARLSLIWSALPGRVAAAVFAVILGALAGVLTQRDQFTVWSESMMLRGIPVMLLLVALWGSWRREEEPGPYGSVVFLLVTSAATAHLLQVP